MFGLGKKTEDNTVNNSMQGKGGNIGYTKSGKPKVKKRPFVFRWKKPQKTQLTQQTAVQLYGAKDTARGIIKFQGKAK